MTPRVVIIGAGIVGCAVADELTARGWTDVTVVEQGPFPVAGGSSSHAPGLVFQTNPSRTMTAFARYTVGKLGGLSYEGAPCVLPVGGLEVATTPERWQDLARKAGWAEVGGVPGRLLDPAECVALHPLLDRERLLGGFHTPTDGLVKAVRAGGAQFARARARGARMVTHRQVTGISVRSGRVTGVGLTDVATGIADGVLPADVVISAAGLWGPAIGALVGTAVPLLPLAHQYATTGPLAVLHGATAVHDGAEARLPILRHQDADLYAREHGDRIGLGSYAHRPMPVALDGLSPTGQPATLPFTEEDFAPSWQDAVDLLPALADTKIEEGLNGVFSFTPDGFPLLGESREVRGFWLAEAVWVTHSAGVGRAVAEWLVDGEPSLDLHECDVHRFDDAQLGAGYVAARGAQAFVEVYDVIHPLDQVAAPRPLRTGPFHERQEALGAVFHESGGWERSRWYEANAGLPRPDLPERDPWAARHWSPVVAAEAVATRTTAGLYDMTPLTRIEVTGPGALAFLLQLTTGRLDRPVGSVSYGLLLSPGGGVRSDLTVARLGEQEFLVCAGGPIDRDLLLREAGDGVHVRDVTAGTCGVGLWGPAARKIMAPLTATDVSRTGFRFYTARRMWVGDVPVTALRISYVGELGWELYTTADLGRRLWDTLWDGGREHGLVAGGRGAFDSLRLEKGYRLAGTDLTLEHDPFESGVGFAVRTDGPDFVGRAALSGRSAETRLTTLRTEQVVLGGEPVRSGGACVGYVTSAGYGHTSGCGLAYAWLPTELATPGTPLEIRYLGRNVPAVTAPDAVVDPTSERLRS